MPYIGNTPADKFLTLAKQNFSTSATTSYTLDSAVSSTQDIALFINSVRQSPVDAYTVSGTALTLTSATAGTDEMYCVYLGKTVGTVNTPNDSVGLDQLSATGTPSSSNYLRGDNSWASAGTSLTGSTDNQVTTVTGANAIQGETNFIYNGTIVGAGSDGANADLGVGIHIKSADSGASASANSDELVIEGGSSDNTGISILSDTDGTGQINFGDSGDNDAGRVYYNHSNNDMRLYTNGTEYFRIKNNGYIVAIGVYNQSAGDSANVVIDGSGNLYRSTSALKYKQDVRDLESIDISSFRPVRYKSKSPKDDPNKDFLGFIADEFHDAGLTELVSYNISYAEDDTKKENPIYEVEGFNYDRLTAILTKSLQEANEKIKILETKVTALENA